MHCWLHEIAHYHITMVIQYKRQYNHPLFYNHAYTMGNRHCLSRDLIVWWYDSTQNSSEFILENIKCLYFLSFPNTGFVHKVEIQHFRRLGPVYPAYLKSYLLMTWWRKPSCPRIFWFQHHARYNFNLNAQQNDSNRHLSILDIRPCVVFFLVWSHLNFERLMTHCPLADAFKFVEI